MKDLLKILSDDVCDEEGFCSSRDYRVWEEKSATPTLEKLGYQVIRWTDGERDSFGPLSRIVVVEKDGGRQKFFYG